jgi:hypothetical protein
VLFTHGGATVPATVFQDVDVVLLVANNDHRTPADGRRLEVAAVAHFTFVGDPPPGAVENLFQLGVEQRRIVVQRDVNAVVFDQFVRAFRRCDQPVFMSAHAVLLMAF